MSRLECQLSFVNALGIFMRLFKSDIEKSLDEAKSYSEWKTLALEHDKQAGLEYWKMADESSRYDYGSIRSRLDHLQGLRSRGDNHGLLYALNEGIHGNMGRMGCSSLYSNSKIGTKHLIESYVNEITSTLEHLASPDVDDISADEKVDFFRRASHCFGYSAMMLSGAGTLLYFHVGTVKALWEENLLPSVLSGSSGGAIVCGIIGTHTDEELSNIFEPANIRTEIKSEEKIWKGVSLLGSKQLNVEDISKALNRMMPNLTFQEAYKKTGRQINISIAPAEQHQTSRLLNHITSPNVFIREALLASSAVPGIFPPVALYAKNSAGKRQPYLPSRLWRDGSVTNDLPAKRLGRLYGVNHFIASQTNPLAFPFIFDQKNNKGVLSIVSGTIQSNIKDWFKAYANIGHNKASKHPATRNFLSVINGIINQDYTADITILPPSRLFAPHKLLAHRSDKEILELLELGEKAAWPKLDMINTQTKISRTLEKILKQYGKLETHKTPINSMK